MLGSVIVPGRPALLAQRAKNGGPLCITEAVCARINWRLPITVFPPEPHAQNCVLTRARPPPGAAAETPAEERARMRDLVAEAWPTLTESSALGLQGTGLGWCAPEASMSILHQDSFSTDDG